MDEKQIQKLIEDITKNNNEATVEQHGKLVESITNGMTSMNEDLKTSLASLLEEVKITNSKLPSENSGSKADWRNSFLTEVEQTASEKDKKIIAFDRLFKNMYKQYIGQASPEEQNALLEYQKNAATSPNRTTDNESGGYAVPEDLVGVIMDEMNESGIAQRDTTPITILRGNSVKFTTVAAGDYPFTQGGHPKPSFTEEGGEKPVEKYEFGEVSLSLKKEAFILPVTDEMLSDAIIDIGSLLQQSAPTYFSLVQDAHLFRGNGQSGSNKIKGIYEYTTLFEDLSSSNFSDLSWKNMIGAVAKTRSIDMRNAKWYVHPTIWYGVLRLLEDNENRPIIGLNDNSMQFMGIPVELSDACVKLTETGVAKPLIVLGNLKKIYRGTKGSLTMDFSNSASYTVGEVTRSAWQRDETVFRLVDRYDFMTPFENRLTQIRSAGA